VTRPKLERLRVVEAPGVTHIRYARGIPHVVDDASSSLILQQAEECSTGSFKAGSVSKRAELQNGQSVTAR
jgi:hypothetical protein